MADESEYVAQLKEVFLSCDSSGTGKLNRRDLTELCEKLQLEDQADALIERLIGSSERCVGFEEFKDGFVLVLSSVVDTLDSTEDEASAKDDGLASPKLERGKTFSRNAQIDAQGADTPLDFPTDLSDTELSYASPSETPQPRSKRKHFSTPVNSNLAAVVGDASVKRPRSADGMSYSHAEIYETDGAMARSTMDNEASAAAEAAKEEEHLRSIWKLLGVGTNGYLSIKELAIVCEHIGMEAMDDKELRHLFDKLDADGDQLVSFDEFLSGLFQHGSSSGGAKDPDEAARRWQQQSSTPVRSTSSQKRVVRMSSTLTLEGERGTMQTPNMFSAMFGPGFFSYVDSDSDGCARAEDILQAWETFGISRDEANAVLQALELDGSESMRLQELSMALERELLTNDMDNAVYQVAVCSLRKELQHVKAVADARRAEADKLQHELDTVKARGDLLVKEADERHARLERALEARAHDAERRHADQLRAAQAQADGEREAAAAAAAQQRLHWESADARRRDEEARLREALTAAERHAELLEAEQRDGAAKCASLSAEVARLKRDLDAVPVLRNKILELEASRDELSKVHNRSIHERLQTYEDENKSLRDRNDELSAEVEHMRLQLAGRGRRGRSGSSGRDSSSAAVLRRQGSRLSDYAAKPLPAGKGSAGSADGSSSQSDDDQAAEAAATMAAQLEQVTAEVSSLQAQHEVAIEEIRTQHVRERRELVRTHEERLLARTVEAESKQKEAVQKVLREEKVRAEKREAEWQRRLDSDRALLKAEAQRERHDVVEKHEAEKQKLLTATAVKHGEELQQLQASLTVERDALRVSHSQQALEQFEQAIAKEGVGALKGKLRDDFDRLVVAAAAAAEEQSKLEQCDTDASHARELAALRRRYEEQIDEVEQQMADLEQQLEEERVSQQRRHEQQLAELEQRAEDERAAAESFHERRIAELQQQMDDEKEFLAEDVRSRMETEFISEIEKIRFAFQEERDDYESRLRAAQQELRHAKVTLTASSQAAETSARSQRSELEAAREDRLRLQRQYDGVVVEKAKVERDVQRLRLEQEHRRHAHEHEVAVLKRQLAELQPLPTAATASADGGEAIVDSALHAERQSLLEENERLEQQHAELASRAQQSEEQAFELTTRLQLAESQHARTEQELRLRLNKMVDAAAVHQAEALLDAERRRRGQLERALDERATESAQLLLHMQEEHKLAMMEASSEREALSRRLTVTRSALADVTQKLKEQLEKSTRADYLIKDLYVENAQLMKALYLTEQRQKTAELAKHKLEDHRRALQDALLKICPAAVASV